MDQAGWSVTHIHLLVDQTCTDRLLTPSTRPVRSTNTYLRSRESWCWAWSAGPHVTRAEGHVWSLTVGRACKDPGGRLPGEPASDPTDLPSCYPSWSGSRDPPRGGGYYADPDWRRKNAPCGAPQPPGDV